MNAPIPQADGAAQPTDRWLNRNVIGMTITSLLSDLGHEMATAILPAFLALLGISPAVLGAIEGIADATSSFVKLGTGWLSDRLGHRKAITAGGYALTGASQAIFALANGWGIVLAGRVVGWFGRGIRGPLRDAMLADSIPPAARGKAFGLHRAGDTLGAVLGPLLAVALIPILHVRLVGDASRAFRVVFLLTAIPGLASALVFALVVRERRRAPNHALRFWTAIRSMPTRLRRALVGVGIFGLGDFSHTLIILAGIQLLTPTLGTVKAASVAGLLYVLHNITYALAPFPVGALSDRIGRRALLTGGYVLGAVVSLTLGLMLARGDGGWIGLAVVFALAGIMLGIEDTLEGAMVADFAPTEVRGTAYGVLGTVNGIGDLVSSVLVGALWTLHPLWGFGYATAMMALGAAMVLRVR
jgi:MFS family permease